MKKDPSTLYLHSSAFLTQSKNHNNFNFLAMNEKITQNKDNLPELIATQPETIPYILNHTDPEVLAKITPLLLKLMIKTDLVSIQLILKSKNITVKSRINYYMLKFMIEKSTDVIPLIFEDFNLLEKVDTHLLDMMLRKSESTIDLLLESKFETILTHVNRHRVAQIIEQRPQIAERLANHGSHFITQAYSEYRRKLAKQEQETMTIEPEVSTRKSCTLI